jgi:hypothetical protein
MIVIQAQNYLDNTNGSGYAGMTYGIVENWTPVFDLKSKSVSQGVLDANGHAAFELKMKANRRYYLGIQKPDNVYYSEITLQESLDHEKNNTFNFKYAPRAYLKFILNNVNCNGDSDTIKYKRIAHGLIEEVEGDHQVTKPGCVNIESDFFERPIGEYEYIWEVTKNNITTYHSEAFTLNENEYKTFQIDY